MLFDAYVHGAIDRRGFLDKAAKYAVGGVTAAMLLDQLSPRFAEAQVVRPEDPRIRVQYLEYESPRAPAGCAATWPSRKGRRPLPAVPSSTRTAG